MFLFLKIEKFLKLRNRLFSKKSTLDHVGLYEKYGFSFLKEADNIWGGKSRILFRPL